MAGHLPEEDEKIKELQGQWLFVVLGTLLALFAGLTVSALYELLKTTSSALYIFTLFGILTVLLLDAFSYIFEHLKELRKDPVESASHLAYKYLNYRWYSIKACFKKSKIFSIDITHIMASKYWQALAWLLFVTACVATYYFFAPAPKTDGTAALVATAALIIWYSWETLQLRQVTQRTLEIEQTPVVTLEMVYSQTLASVMDIAIKNIGRQNAYNIEFAPISANDLNCLFRFDSPNNYLEPTLPAAEPIRLTWIVRRNDKATLIDQGTRYFFNQIHAERKSAIILFHYSDAIGQRYHGVYTLSSKVSFEFDPFLQYIEVGKGTLTYAQAEERVRKVPQEPHYAIMFENYIDERVRNTSL